jgi:hypothetical protein
MDKEINIVSPTKQSKVVKYKIEQDVVNLRSQGFSYQDIADELNASGKVPPDGLLDKYVIMRFLEKMPEITRQIVQEDKRRLVEIVQINMDIVHETSGLYHRAKAILEAMETRAATSEYGYVDPYRFKAIASEMRELLKSMTEIQREVSDADNVRKFMEIVMDVLKQEAPDKIPIIADKLRVMKGTQWFSDMMKRGTSNE